MYADAVVAAILQADLIEGPIKNMTTSAKVDRMHFKVNFIIKVRLLIISNKIYF